MLVFLLLSLLAITDVTESQATRATFDGNRTFNLPNGTAEPRNVTAALWEDERSRLDQRPGHQTSDHVTEEDERFQDPKRGLMMNECDREAMVHHSSNCGAAFHDFMSSLGREHWCLLKRFSSPYHMLNQCLEEISQFFGCFYPNSDAHSFFLDVHALYFGNCSREEFYLEDAPDGLVAALTLIPIGLIPVLVYLVVERSSVASSTAEPRS